MAIPLTNGHTTYIDYSYCTLGEGQRWGEREEGRRGEASITCVRRLSQRWVLFEDCCFEIVTCVAYLRTVVVRLLIPV